MLWAHLNEETGTATIYTKRMVDRAGFANLSGVPFDDVLHVLRAWAASHGHEVLTICDARLGTSCTVSTQ